MSSNVKVRFDFSGLLTFLSLIFACLKWAKVAPFATWSWWLVLLPVLIGIGTVILWILFLLIVVILSHLPK